MRYSYSWGGNTYQVSKDDYIEALENQLQETKEQLFITTVELDTVRSYLNEQV